MEHSVIHQAKNYAQPCGDCYYVSDNAPWFFILADGLGSGDEARFAANTAISVAKEFCQKYREDRKLHLSDLICRCHQELKSTRGAAIGGVLLDEDNNELLFCGVGNIRLTLAGRHSKSVFSQPGIVGAQTLPRLSVKGVPLKDYFTGFLFSDGISPESVLAAAQNPYLPLKRLAEEVYRMNKTIDDKTLIVFSIHCPDQAVRRLKQ